MLHIKLFETRIHLKEPNDLVACFPYDGLMKLSTETESRIRLLLREYWNGDRSTEQFSIEDGVQLTVDHTESDELVFAVSLNDFTQYSNAVQPPDALSEYDSLSEIATQINSIVESEASNSITPFKLYRQPLICQPMVQYLRKIDLSNITTTSSLDI